MSVELTAKAPTDVTRINVHAPHEVHWWSLKLAVTPHDIHTAVNEVGPSAEEVGRKLRSAAKTAFSGGGED